MLDRRSFLAGIGSVAAAPAFSAVPASGNVDVVIIGAGAAGIAAGRRLAAAGKQIAIVEAADRVGGRCQTDTRLFGVPFDRGAHWLHAADVNPLVKIAAQTKLDVHPVPPGQRLRIDRRYAREGEMENFLAALIRCYQAIAETARGKTDLSSAKVLPKELGDLRATIEYILGPFSCGKDIAEISAMDFAKAADRDGPARCREGLGTLVAALASGLPIRLSAAATRIDLSRRSVQVETGKGIFTAPAAIVTASTNVLASGKIKFAPPLSKRELDAVTRLSLGSYDHIAVEFAGNPLGLRGDELVFEKSSGARTAALFANVNGGPLCLIEVAGSFGRSLAGQGEAAMAAFAADWLSGLYGAGIRKAIRRSHATQWNREPWVLGAMSAAAPGFHAARRALMEPVRDRLWFAGEAAHETLWGTVAGAWESGERAADAVVKRLSPAPARRRHRR